MITCYLPVYLKYPAKRRDNDGAAAIRNVDGLCVSEFCPELSNKNSRKRISHAGKVLSLGLKARPYFGIHTYMIENRRNGLAFSVMFDAHKKRATE